MGRLVAPGPGIPHVDWGTVDSRAFLLLCDRTLRDKLRRTEKIELPKIRVFVESEQIARGQRQIAIGLLFGVLAMSCALLVLFRSYRALLISLLSIPVAIGGGLAGLEVTGESLNLFSGIGVLLLTGLNAKNGILLIDLTLRNVRKGITPAKSAIWAGRTRVVPILMTSIAIVIAMLPSAYGLGEAGGQFASLARCVIGGTLASTVVSLLVVPTLLASMFRRQGIFLWHRTSSKSGPESIGESPAKA